MTAKKFYITTPIYYVNDKPHIGHAYTTVACDVMSRFKRLDGYDVWFLTGTDEHGQKIVQTAEKQGMAPQALTDAVSVNFRDMNALLNISNDQFIRTTDEAHKSAVQAIWKKMEEAGDIYLDKYAGWYSVRDEAYYGDDELITDASGKKMAPTGAPVEWVEEESYFFRLSKWQDRLLDFYERNPDFIQPVSRRNEVISFVKGGLRDLSVSRTTFDWGVKVPGNEKHVMYVWVDALTNYISALGYPDVSSKAFKTFWPADVHMVGKDILRFHAVYWPAFLMSAGVVTPKCVFAHGWWTVEGQKMSKSIGNTIAPKDLVDNYGLDQARYFLMREIAFGSDGDFSQAQALTRINADLANAFGNLCQRTLAQIAKNCEGKIPTPGAFTDDDKALLGKAGTKLLAEVREEFDKFAFHRALEKIWAVVSDANIYIDSQAPWALKKTDTARMGTVLYVLAEVIRNLGLIVQPFMPGSAGKILDQVSAATGERDFSFMGDKHALKPGTTLPAPAGVFPRILSEEEQKKRGMA